MRKIRTVIIEDEIMFRQLMRSTLSRRKSLEIIGEFELGKPGLDFCLKEKPDLLVVDLMLPDMNGLEVAAVIRRKVPEMRILVLTAHPSPRLPADLIALGIGGYVDKTEPIAYVLDAIDTVCRGGMYFATHVAAKSTPLAGTVGGGPLDHGLTLREQQIARLVAAGQVSKEIAHALDLGSRTVEKHRKNIMRKAGVQEVASLTRWCVQVGLMSP